MTYIDHDFDPNTPLSHHELGELADMITGHVPMAPFTPEPAPRVPPLFPLHTYLVLKHGEP